MLDRYRLVKICRITKRWVIYSILFFIPIFFAWFQENYSVFDLNKSIALHTLLGVGVLAWVLEVFLENKIQYKASKTVLLLGLGVVILFLITTIFSIHPMLSLWGSYERMQGFYNLIHYIGFTFLIIVSLRNRKDIDSAVISLLVGSGIACIYGFLQAAKLDPLRWGEDLGRIFSSFGQPNFFGHYVSTLLPLTCYAIFYIGKNFYTRILLSMLFVLQITNIFFTYSRGAWLAVGLTIIILAIWFLYDRGRKKIIIVLLAFLLLIVSIFGFLITRGIIQQSQQSSFAAVRLISLFDLSSDLSTNKTRLLYWESGLKAWYHAPLERKLIGYGPDTQASLFVKYYQPEWAYHEQINSFPDRAHNFVIDILLQFGLIGLGLFSAFVVYITWYLYKSLKRSDKQYHWLGVSLLAALLIYGINNLFSFSLVGMNVILYGLLGLAVVTNETYNTRSYIFSFFRPISKILIFASLGALFIVLMYHYNFKYYLADYYYFNAKKAEAIGDCPKILDNMDTVVELYPFNQYLNRQYIHLGVNCFSAVTKQSSYHDLGRALEFQAQSIPEKERQFYTLIDISHLYSLMGFYVDKQYYEKADEMYKEMLAISPYITTTYQDYGRMKLWQRKNDEAIAIFKKGLEITPPYTLTTYNRKKIVEQTAYFYTLIGMAYYDKVNLLEAINWYKKALEINPAQTAAYKNLSDTYYQIGEIEKAIEYTERAYRIDKNNNLWSFSLATLYKEQGNIPEAKKYAQIALDLSPDDEKVKNLIKELGSE